MKKTILLLMLSSLMLADPILERLEALEAEIRELKAELKKSKERETLTIKAIDALPKMQAQIDENREISNDMEPILDFVEKKSLTDRINFSPELQLRVDKMNYSLGEIAGENTTVQPAGTIQRRDQFKKDFSPAASIRFRLNMNANLLEDVSFNGRMVVQHSSQSDERLCILSHDIKSAPSQTAMDVDRAYFDYLTNRGSNYPFTLSFGILPTTGGTPMQYAALSPRKSMFPALVFDMDSVGLIATTNISSLLNQNTYLRFILAKAFTLNANIYPYQCNRENIDNANIIGAYVDTRFDFYGHALFSAGFNILNSLKAHPYLGPDIDASNSHDLGDMITLGAGLDISNFASSDTTIFLHTALSNPHPSGAVDDYQIVNPATGLSADGTVGFSDAAYAKGSMIDSNGYSLYAGAIHALTKSVDIAIEYNYGSKYWFSATQGAEDMYNKLATRGQVAEAYVLWQLNKYIYTKLGYMYSNEDYTGSGWHFGEPTNKDGKQSVGYFLLNAKF